MMNGDDTFDDRQSDTNIGEERFEAYCKSKSYFCCKIGFSEKDKKVPNFYLLHIYLRNLPDYLIFAGGKISLVNVKGTSNFKREELYILPELEGMYANANSPLVYAFCFEGKDPIFLDIREINTRYQASLDKKYKVDNKVYRSLRL